MLVNENGASNVSTNLAFQHDCRDLYILEIVKEACQKLYFWIFLYRLRMEF